MDDTADVLQRTVTSILTLNNDIDPDGDAITISSVSDPVHGTVWFNAEGIDYQADIGFYGLDSFTYTIIDEHGATDTATVTVLVQEIITLSESASVAYGFEGGNLFFFFSASTIQGFVTTYEIDLDNNGGADLSEDHQLPINGALFFDVGGHHLIGNPLDDGEYPVLLTVSTSEGVIGDFEFELEIFNVPPAVVVSGDNAIPLNESYELSFSWSDPGPDTVTSASVDWGDDTNESALIDGVSAAAFQHVYVTDGIYIQSVRVEDEDGTWGADRYFNAGDTDAPQTPDNSPSLTVVDVAIQSNGDAVLIVEAVDYSEQPLTTCEWDTDLDETYETVGSCTIVLQPGPDYYAYGVALKLQDAAGVTTERLILFNNVEDLYIGWWLGYRKDFEAATPDLPDDWHVHHSYAQRGGIVIGGLANRYLMHGINVDDVAHLRGVPPEVHKDITKLQNAWWAEKSRLYNRPTPEIYWVVPFEEVKAFDEQVDELYKDYMIKAGKNQAKQLSQINTALSRTNGRFEFAMGKAQRWQAVGLRVAGVITFLGGIGANAKTMASVATFDPNDQEFNEFQDAYEYALKDASENSTGQIGKNRANQVREAFTNWVRSIGQGSVADRIDIGMIKWIELNIPLP